MVPCHRPPIGAGQRIRRAALPQVVRRAEALAVVQRPPPLLHRPHAAAHGPILHSPLSCNGGEHAVAEGRRRGRGGRVRIHRHTASARCAARGAVVIPGKVSKLLAVPRRTARSLADALPVRACADMVSQGERRDKVRRAGGLPAITAAGARVVLCPTLGHGWQGAAPRVRAPLGDRSADARVLRQGNALGASGAQLRQIRLLFLELRCHRCGLPGFAVRPGARCGALFVHIDEGTANPQLDLRVRKGEGSDAILFQLAHARRHGRIGRRVWREEQSGAQLKTPMPLAERMRCSGGSKA
mmetsp:Transcript_77887/g.226024  ORF Transcript_77887/g.226024 Transcript_77887/m.226024 type:complete len:299 (+) Transcript_77887:1219-2115(+)